MPPAPVLRVVLALLTLVGGAAVGLLSVVVHPTGVGIVLALLATVSSVLALPPGWWSRLPWAAGWMAVVLYASNPRPEGDYLVAADTQGYLLLGTGLAMVVLAVVTVRGRPRTVVAPADSGAVGDPS